MDKNVGVLCIGGDKRHCIAENYLYDLGFDTALCLNEHLAFAKGVSMYQMQSNGLTRVIY